MFTDTNSGNFMFTLQFSWNLRGCVILLVTLVLDLKLVLEGNTAWICICNCLINLHQDIGDSPVHF